MSKDHELSNEIEDLIQTCPDANDPALTKLLLAASKLNERCDKLSTQLRDQSAVINELVGRANE